MGGDDPGKNSRFDHNKFKVGDYLQSSHLLVRIPGTGQADRRGYRSGNGPTGAAQLNRMSQA
jgi:hypothetical protein